MEKLKELKPPPQQLLTAEQVCLMVWEFFATYPKNEKERIVHLDKLLKYHLENKKCQY